MLFIFGKLSPKDPLQIEFSRSQIPETKGLIKLFQLFN